MMGGRGQKYTVVMRLPNASTAKIPSAKLKNYLLNPSKDANKAKFFQSLGYNMKNAARLQRDIRAKLKTNKALKYETDQYGNTSFQVNMQLGINKKAIVATAWIIDKGSNIPRFVTAYQNKKLNK